jgi:hypothetical protein
VSNNNKPRKDTLLESFMAERLLKRFKTFLLRSGVTENELELKPLTQQVLEEVILDAVNDAVARGAIPQDQYRNLARYLGLRLFPDFAAEGVRDPQVEEYHRELLLSITPSPEQQAVLDKIAADIDLEPAEKRIKASWITTRDEATKKFKEKYPQYDIGQYEDPNLGYFARTDMYPMPPSIAIGMAFPEMSLPMIQRATPIVERGFPDEKDQLIATYESIATDWQTLIGVDPDHLTSQSRLKEFIATGTTTKDPATGQNFIPAFVLSNPNDPRSVEYLDFIESRMPQLNQSIINYGVTGGDYGTIVEKININAQPENQVIQGYTGWTRQRDFEAGVSQSKNLAIETLRKATPGNPKTAIESAYNLILASPAIDAPGGNQHVDIKAADIKDAQDVFNSVFTRTGSIEEASSATTDYLLEQGQSILRRSSEARSQEKVEEFDPKAAANEALGEVGLPLTAGNIFFDPSEKAVYNNFIEVLIVDANKKWQALQGEKGQYMSHQQKIDEVKRFINESISTIGNVFHDRVEEYKASKREEDILTKFETKENRENYIKEIIGATGAFSLTDEDLNVLQQGLVGVGTIEQANAIANEALSDDYQQRAAQAAGQVEQKAQRETYDKIQKRFLAEEGLTPDEVDRLPPESQNLLTQEADGLSYYRPFVPPGEPEGLGRMPPPLPSPLGGISLAQERQIPIERGIFGDVFRGVGEEAVAEEESPAFLNFLFGRQAEMEEEYAADKERQRQADLDAYLEDIAVGEMGPISRGSIIPGLSPWEAGLAGDKPHPGTGYTTPPSEMSPADQIAAAQRMSESRRPIPIREDEDDPKLITDYRKMPGYTPGRFFGEQEEELRKEFESTPAGIMSMIQGKPEPKRKRKARTVYRRARI